MGRSENTGEVYILRPSSEDILVSDIAVILGLGKLHREYSIDQVVFAEGISFPGAMKWCERANIPVEDHRSKGSIEKFTAAVLSDQYCCNRLVYVPQTGCEETAIHALAKALSQNRHVEERTLY